MITSQQLWDTINEGGEGYRPEFARRAVPIARVIAKTSAVVMVRDERGNLVPADKMAARLAKDIDRLARVTDVSARRLIQASIEHAQAQLA
jgi:hypothetical protein